MVVFKMRESVPIARYSPVCNVLRQWKTLLILTYRVYRLYDYITNKNISLQLCKINVSLKIVASKCGCWSLGRALNDVISVQCVFKA